MAEGRVGDLALAAPAAAPQPGHRGDRGLVEDTRRAGCWRMRGWRWLIHSPLEYLS